MKFSMSLDKLEVLNGMVLVELKKEEREEKKIIVADSDIIRDDEFVWSEILKVAPDVENLEVGDKILVPAGIRPEFLPIEGKDKVFLLHNQHVKIYMKK